MIDNVPAAKLETTVALRYVCDDKDNRAREIFKNKVGPTIRDLLLSDGDDGFFGDPVTYTWEKIDPNNVIPKGYRPRLVDIVKDRFGNSTNYWQVVYDEEKGFTFSKKPI